ncbi:MBL fold metallo-hydrolase [Curtobacterium sp. MWU13-2055]|uniref:MBL fold metallo-hydrolase n=1 Tax=Curtobacterium sp. MWU13-2055 TaxID=2931928 RepID=UPI00200DEA5C|nr:MBL fold metallo-hydrolase [Curtobacterium sp. MWU13-2055]
MSASATPLETVTDDLLATPTARLPYQHDVLLRSYLLRRSTGNVLVYNSPGIAQAADAINAAGGAELLLINHAHESMYGRPPINVPIAVHRADWDDIARAMPVAQVYDGPQTIGDDLEVIPTPGHTPGTTSYLWDSGTHRYLFTGDFIWIEGGEWKAVVLDPGLRSAYVRSLEIVRDLDFDVLVPWGASEDGSPVAITSEPGEAAERIQMIIDRVSMGGSR